MLGGSSVRSSHDLVVVSLNAVEYAGSRGAAIEIPFAAATSRIAFCFVGFVGRVAESGDVQEGALGSRISKSDEGEMACEPIRC